jgi:hypothetical protein
MERLSGSYSIGKSYSGKMKAAQRIFCLAAAAALLAFCSRSSPLYPFNYWVDSNCFFTVGKSMMKGLVTYRDIYEQKGPLLYFLHGLAYFISRNSFTGVYILEVLAFGAFLKSIISILRHFHIGLPCLLAVILGALILSSPAFGLGDSAEELCLPFISWSLYYLLKLSSSDNKKITLSLPVMLLNGVFTGCILWIKFNLLGFHLGWILSILIINIYRKGFIYALKSAGAYFAGIIIVSIPVLAYFSLNSALGDLWTAYFYNNIFLYPVQAENQVESLMQKLNNFSAGLYHNPGYALPVLIGLLWVLLCKKKHMSAGVKAGVILSFALLAAGVYGGGRSYGYYSLILSPFSVLALLPISRLGAKHMQKERHRLSRHAKILITIAGFALCVLYAYCYSNDNNQLGEDKSQLVQYNFSKIMHSQKENPTLLNYGFLDGGFYTAADIVPTCKYFCILNIPLKEMQEVQDECLSSGAVDFVVTRDMELDTQRFNKYSLAATGSFYSSSYYLYYRMS